MADADRDPTTEAYLKSLLRDERGVPETVYLAHRPQQSTDEGWWVPSIDVGSWRPLAVGDCVVALDRTSPDEFLVQVTAIDDLRDEVFYQLRHIADLDPAAEPSLAETRT